MGQTGSCSTGCCFRTGRLVAPGRERAHMWPESPLLEGAVDEQVKKMLKDL